MSVVEALSKTTLKASRDDLQWGSVRGSQKVRALQCGLAGLQVSLESWQIWLGTPAAVAPKFHTQIFTFCFRIAGSNSTTFFNLS
jgi:hypothetical protein